MSELDFGKENLKGSENQRIFYLDEQVKTKYQTYLTEERSVQEMLLGNVKLALGVPDKQYIKKFNEEI